MFCGSGSGKEGFKMSFGENLQFCRKRNDITQEQLAERMNVSRQTISKWESENSYPEMEKLLQLCELFGCTMDVLLRGDVQENFQEDAAGYDRHMNRFSIKIVSGIGGILFGMALYLLGEAFQKPDYLVNTVFLLVAMTGILILIEGGMQHDRFVKKHPRIQPFYREEELELAEGRFRVRILAGIGILFAGVLSAAMAEGFPVPVGCTEEIYDCVSLLIFTVGICIIVYAGMQKSKYNVEEYNKENSPVKGRKDQLIVVWCGCIMILATILFFIAGLGYEMWEKCWIVYPIGGMLCGIATLILNWVYKE